MDFEALDQEIIACRKCPRLVAWREEVAQAKRKAIRIGSTGAGRFSASAIIPPVSSSLASRLAHMARTARAGSLLVMPPVNFFIPPCTAPVLPASLIQRIGTMA